MAVHVYALKTIIFCRGYFLSLNAVLSGHLAELNQDLLHVRTNEQTNGEFWA